MPEAQHSEPVTPVAANDFSRQWDEIASSALDAVDRVGRSGWLVLGEEVRRFETELAAWWGVSHAVGVASGLDALEIALRCAGVGHGDRVITTPLTAFATTLAILRVGAEPLWCDIDDSGGIDLDLAERMLANDRGARALLPVHLYGHPLDPAALRRLADEHELVLIEDCAQAAGAWRDGPTGTSGIAAAVSLYPTKNLGALGDGGVLLTGDESVAEHARRLRNYGQAGRYEHVDLGLNSRLDELHAAVLRSALLPSLDGWLERRRQVAQLYAGAIDAMNGPVRCVLPSAGRSAHHLFPIEILEGSPAAVADALHQRGVVVGRHYPTLCCDQPALDHRLRAPADAVPVARRLAAQELSLPIHPQLTDPEVATVIEALEALP